MLTDLLLASQNAGKLSEMRQLAEGLPFRVLGPAELGLTESPEETGTDVPRERDAEGPLLRATLRAADRG